MAAIAIVGAGLAGMCLAHALASQHSVKVFEKSRGVGGRMATRCYGDSQFDHGAQYFSARSSEFKAFLQPFILGGLVQTWERSQVNFDSEVCYSDLGQELQYVGAPSMTALCKALASSFDVQLNSQVQNLERRKDGWYLQFVATEDADKSGEPSQWSGPFDQVLSTLPANQSQTLMADHSALSERLSQVKMLPCFSLMLSSEDIWPYLWQCANFKHEPIAWVALNNSKPGRSETFALVVQADNHWSEQHLEDEQEKVSAELLVQLKRLLPELSQLQVLGLHRWRYANTAHALGEHCLYDQGLGLGACGDWCIGGRVESAFLSARALAEQVSAKLTSN